MAAKVIGVVGTAAGGVEHLRTELVEPLIAQGCRVAIILTPTAARWLDDLGEVARLAELTGLPVRSQPRNPAEPRPHPRVDAYAVVPASANTVAKLALGISDNQALAAVNESLGSTPTLVFPRVNAAHARHPSWESHLALLRRAGVRLVYGDHVWPLHEPRSTADGDRTLPWPAILTGLRALVA